MKDEFTVAFGIDDSHEHIKIKERLSLYKDKLRMIVNYFERIRK